MRRYKTLLNGNYTASITLNCKPKTNLNIRPILTTKGELLEWQMPLKGFLDYQCLIKGPKPQPGQPIATPDVIRFHKDDVTINP